MISHCVHLYSLLDRDEFKEVMRRMRERTRQGLAQQNTLHSALNVSTAIENGGLVEQFFGKDGQKQLPHEEFEKFLRQLHDEVRKLCHTRKPLFGSFALPLPTSIKWVSLI